MQIVRFLDPKGTIQFGQQHSKTEVELLSGELFTGLQPTGQAAQVTKLLAPLAPVSIQCIGLNYRQHALETGSKIPEYPVLFVKGITAVQNPLDPILLPTFLRSEQVDHECELAVVIGKTCKNIRRADALDYVLGYTCGNDVSARDWQKQKGGGQFCRGKTFDTFAPLGPCLVTADEIPDPNTLAISTTVNGTVYQEGNTNDMIFDVPTLIEFLSGSTTLLPGTVIMTGTPHGVGMAASPPRWLQPGDTVTVEIEGIGRLTNPVENEP